MLENQYYRKLEKAAKSKNKSELEIYRNISRNLDEILVYDLEQDKILLLKSLIMYVEGKRDNSWYIGIMQIVFAILMCVFGILLNGNFITTFDIKSTSIVLVICSVIILMDRYNNPYASRKRVLCVLNDKLNEISTGQDSVDAALKSNENASSSKSKNKKKRKHKKNKT